MMVPCLATTSTAKTQHTNDNAAEPGIRKCRLLNQVPFWCRLYLSVNWHGIPKRASNRCASACLLSIIPNDWLQFLTAWSCTFFFPQTFFCSRCLCAAQTVWSLLSFTLQLLWHSVSSVSVTRAAPHICAVNIMASNPERLLRPKMFLLQILSCHLMSNMARRWHRWNHSTSCKCW